MSKRVLLTGASGFIGSHVLESLLNETDYEVVCLSRVGTAGDLHRHADSIHVKAHARRVHFVFHDLKYPIPDYTAARIGRVDYVLHLAANSHVDRSIVAPLEFVYDNVVGTANLWEWARRQEGIERIISYNTDEVFGPAPDGYDFKEWDRWKPSNPYSASKAGQAALDTAYHATYGLPVLTTHTMNVFGERQNPEKLVPKVMRAILLGAPMPIHAKLTPGIEKTTDPSQVLEVGQRHWLHARNAASATLFLLTHGEPGERYNIVGDTELTNLEMVQAIERAIGRAARVEYVDFHRTRPGHDRRYALDGTKLAEMGWKAPVGFQESMERTVAWTLRHPEWLGLPGLAAGTKL